MLWLVLFTSLIVSIHGEGTISATPYQVAIKYFNKWICGGSIISSKHILTSAQCTDGASASGLIAAAGVDSLSEGGQAYPVVKVHQHPQFSRMPADYDLAILELDGEIQFDGTRQPIRLPPRDFDPLDGTPALISGWRTPGGGSMSNDRLQTGILSILGRAACQSAFAGMALISERNICTSPLSVYGNACLGDTGGPLASNGVQVGVVSWNRHCTDPVLPAVYSRTSYYIDFVEQFTGTTAY